MVSMQCDSDYVMCMFMAEACAQRPASKTANRYNSSNVVHIIQEQDKDTIGFHWGKAFTEVKFSWCICLPGVCSSKGIDCRSTGPKKFASLVSFDRPHYIIVVVIVVVAILAQVTLEFISSGGGQATLAAVVPLR